MIDGLTLQAISGSNNIAFKEWAVVCEALRRGRQSLILRKGGIHEGRDGFRVEHNQFWLYPTEFHQNPDVLSPDAASFLDDIRSQEPPEGVITLRCYAVVEEVIELRDESRLDRLQGLHIWSDKTVDQRYHYRTPGLFALVVRIFEFQEAIRIPFAPRYGGCRSWVDLDESIITEGIRPVMGNEEYAKFIVELRRALTD